jgi:hypothetical protein
MAPALQPRNHSEKYSVDKKSPYIVKTEQRNTNHHATQHTQPIAKGQKKRRNGLGYLICVQNAQSLECQSPEPKNKSKSNSEE